jgi:hypothetical protein
MLSGPEIFNVYVVVGSMGWHINDGDGMASALLGAGLMQTALMFLGFWLDHRYAKRQMKEFQNVMDSMMAEVDRNKKAGGELHLDVKLGRPL